MGVKGLWSLLTPFCDRRPLYELEGKTIAIDLAGWVCEALTVVDYSVQPRFYLRNLFFRTYHLLQLGVQPVYVLDGVPPALKAKTIAARNAIQFKGARPRDPNSKSDPKPNKNRSHFKGVLRQCEILLECLGIKCVHGWGEAEAMCAYLNADGFVDACVSQDSDCFVYGAKIVFRNFSLSQQGAHANKGGAVDVYDIGKVPNLGRNKMVVLALLCGCDYNDGGVNGVGKDAALKFLEQFSEDVVLERVLSWRTEVEKFEELEKVYNNPDICTGCGHLGKIQKHSRSGCIDCRTNFGCDSETYKDKRILVKNELSIREKALIDPEFPSQEIIDEFLIRKDEIPKSLDLSWTQPNLIAFIKFMLKNTEWPEIYSFEKCLPLLTRWQVLNYQSKGILHPESIKKKVRPKGISSFQILWNDKDGHLRGVFDKVQVIEWMENNKVDNLDTLWTTVEPEHLVTKAFPELVQVFLDSKIKKKPPPKRKKKLAIDELNESMQQMGITKKKVGKTEKPAKSAKSVEELENLNDSMNRLFLYEGKQKRISGYLEKVAKPRRLQEIQNQGFNLSQFSDFDESKDDLNVSDIVDNIVKRGNLNLLNLNKD